MALGLMEHDMQFTINIMPFAVKTLGYLKSILWIIYVSIV